MLAAGVAMCMLLTCDAFDDASVHRPTMEPGAALDLEAVGAQLHGNLSAQHRMVSSKLVAVYGVEAAAPMAGLIK